jgi:hypothetical protein
MALPPENKKTTENECNPKNLSEILRAVQRTVNKNNAKFGVFALFCGQSYIFCILDGPVAGAALLALPWYSTSEQRPSSICGGSMTRPTRLAESGIAVKGLFLENSWGIMCRYKRVRCLRRVTDPPYPIRLMPDVGKR